MLGEVRRGHGRGEVERVEREVYRRYLRPRCGTDGGETAFDGSCLFEKRARRRDFRQEQVRSRTGLQPYSSRLTEVQRPVRRKDRGVQVDGARVW